MSRDALIGHGRLRTGSSYAKLKPTREQVAQPGNTLEQETGSYRMVNIDGIANFDSFLGDVSLLVVTRSAQEMIGPMIDHLAVFVEDGGSLIMEMPMNYSQELTGVVTGIPIGLCGDGTAAGRSAA